MPHIRIRQQQPTGPNNTNALVIFDNGQEYPITISDPFTENEEQQLEWYFEQHLRFPFIKQIQAQTTAASILTYGETLFKQIFLADPEIYHRYKEILQTGLHTLSIEIAGPPEFHRWHWEALKDPTQPQPLALHATMVRKNLVPQSIRATLRPSPTINLLIVTARPAGKHDVGYRTISRPLVEALRQAKVPVHIDILRPGTYRALLNHLEEVTSRHNSSTETGSHYHVIHFDVHGALLTHDQLPQEPETNRYLYNQRYGRQDLQPYEGVKAFLALESENDTHADLVEASELANLLITHHIPIAILNACQSGKQIGSSETSLGSRLMQVGVQLVLAMGYSITVSAAELLMRTLYQQLFANHDLSTAIRRARQELYNSKQRRAYFNQTIDLEDWLLPVVYQNQPQHLTVRPFTPEESTTYHGQQATRYQPRQPSYGFLGRDLDILHIEKSLLTKRNLLLVRGMGGVGKTTLLQHLGTWWQTTGLVEHVFYFGYDQQAWTHQQLLTTIAQHLLNPIEYLKDFQPLPLDAQQALLTQRLRAERHLLILDNLESITGTQLAIQHTLPPDEQNALRHLLIDLIAGRTLVLLGSRSGEAWLAQDTVADNIYDLPGLDPEAASTLADLILEKHTATQYCQHKDFQHLLTLLDGFPLALEVVLANLAHHTPADILTALQAGDISLNTGDSQKKTENILRCIDYSHSNLSPAAQHLLLCLAPFTSVLHQDMLDEYTTYLQQQPTLADLPFERWPDVLREATTWGLLSPDPDIPSFLHLQPTLPYFLRTRLHAPEQAAVQHAVETAFRQHYDQLGDALNALLKSKDPEQRQLGQVLTSLEYENLLTALHLALAAQVSISHPYLVLSTYLDTTQDQPRGLELGQTVLASLETYPPDQLAGSLGAEVVGVIDDIANRQLLLKQYAAAEASYQKALTIHLELKIFDAGEIKKRSASIYHQLGIVAQEQRQWQEAQGYYQQALQIYIDFDDRYAQASTYHQLGIVAQEQRQWQEAQAYYQQALQIYIDFNDRYAQASTYHQLGIVAQEQRQWQEAQAYYQQALQINIDFNDRYAQASTYHQLGIMAQKQRQWQEAQAYYQQALQIYIDFNDRYAQASTYHQLGMVAQKQRQWQEAREYFLRALETFVAYKDTHSADIVLRNLALLWQASGDADLPVAIAPIINSPPAEVEALLRQSLGNDAEKAES